MENNSFKEIVSELSEEEIDKILDSNKEKQRYTDSLVWRPDSDTVTDTAANLANLSRIFSIELEAETEEINLT